MAKEARMAGVVLTVLDGLELGLQDNIGSSLFEVSRWAATSVELGGVAA